MTPQQQEAWDDIWTKRNWWSRVLLVLGFWWLFLGLFIDIALRWTGRKLMQFFEWIDKVTMK